MDHHVGFDRYEGTYEDASEKLGSSYPAFQASSLEVVGTVMERSVIYDFLLTFYSNHGPIFYCF